jgi:hypothetical protein
MRSLLLLGAAVAFAATAGCRTQPEEGAGAEAPSAAALPGEIAKAVEPLQHNTWAGWKTGTEVVVRFLDDKRPGAAYHYVQPDLIYRVEKKDKLLVRLQEVNGELTRQEFDIATQTPGLDKASPSRVGAPAKLEIDGVSADCSLVVIPIPIPIPTSQPGTDNPAPRNPNDLPAIKEWTLAGHPELLLRREMGDHTWWAVVSVRARKKIGEREYRCVETRRRTAVNDGFALTTTFLSPEVPGHVVEEITEHCRTAKEPGAPTLSFVSHQQTAGVKVPQ